MEPEATEMQGMEAVLGKVINTAESALTSTSWKCEDCGEPTRKEIVLLGKSRRVPCQCSCQREILLQQKTEEERQRRARAVERLRKYSLMDAKFADSTLAAWDDIIGSEKLKKTVQRYVENWPDMKANNVGLLIYGDPGIGKTYASFSLANEIIQQYREVVVAVSAIGLLSRIKETYGRFGQEVEIDIIRTLENASLLIIDDLGAEQKTDWATAMLYQIIDSRYRGGKPLFITTNLSLAQLQEKLTTSDNVDRTYDRIVEVCLPLQVRGTSNRAAVAKNKREQLLTLLKKEE